MARETAAHKKLAAELTSLLPKLDDEGLAFLIEQANVHLYNMEVDRLNEARQRVVTASDQKCATAEKAKSRKTKGGGKKGSDTNNTPASVFQIKKSAGGGCYHLGYNGNWKTFSDEEMLAMVRIVSAKRPQEEVLDEFFAWLNRERPDTFPDLDITSVTDATFTELARFLKQSFAIRR